MIEAIKSFFFYVYVALVGILAILLILLTAYIFYIWENSSWVVKSLLLLAVALAIILCVYLFVPEARAALEALHSRLVDLWLFSYAKAQELFKQKWIGALLLSLLPIYFLVDNFEDV